MGAERSSGRAAWAPPGAGNASAKAAKATIKKACDFDMMPRSSLRRDPASARRHLQKLLLHCSRSLGVDVTGRRMSYLGEFEQLILFALLRLGDHAYGVAIREVIEERTGKAVSAGAIYTTLARLEERGLVRARTESPQGRMGRPRKYYRLRREGARALQESYATIQSMAGGLIPKLTELVEG